MLTWTLICISIVNIWSVYREQIPTHTWFLSKQLSFWYRFHFLLEAIFTLSKFQTNLLKIKVRKKNNSGNINKICNILYNNHLKNVQGILNCSLSMSDYFFLCYFQWFQARFHLRLIHHSSEKFIESVKTEFPDLLT